MDLVGCHYVVTLKDASRHKRLVVGLDGPTLVVLSDQGEYGYVHLQSLNRFEHEWNPEEAMPTYVGRRYTFEQAGSHFSRLIIDQDEVNVFCLDHASGDGWPTLIEHIERLSLHAGITWGNV